VACRPGSSCPRRRVTCLFPVAYSRLYRHHGLQRPDPSLTLPSYPWRESVYPSPIVLVPATPRFSQSSSIRAQHTIGRGSTSFPFPLVECARDALSAPTPGTATPSQLLAQRHARLTLSEFCVGVGRPKTQNGRLCCQFWLGIHSCRTVTRDDANTRCARFLGILVDSSKRASFLPDLPIAAGDKNPSPVERNPPGFANPFSDHNFADTRPRLSGIVGGDPLLHSETVHTRLQPPTSSLVPISRPVVPEEELDIVPLIRLYLKPTHLSLFLEILSESVPADVPTRLSASITALG
jgi:hypothetical protein